MQFTSNFRICYTIVHNKLWTKKNSRLYPNVFYEVVVPNAWHFGVVKYIPTYCEPKRRRRQTINIDLGVVLRELGALLYLVCSHSIAHIIQLRFLHNTTTTSTSCTADWLVGLTKFEMRHCENSLHAALELCRGCRTSAAAGLSLCVCPEST